MRHMMTYETLPRCEDCGGPAYTDDQDGMRMVSRWCERCLRAMAIRLVITVAVLAAGVFAAGWILRKWSY